jgi:hypothetical protein
VARYKRLKKGLVHFQKEEILVENATLYEKLTQESHVLFTLFFCSLSVTESALRRNGSSIIPVNAYKCFDIHHH